MPIARANGASLFYSDEGEGDTVVFSHSYLADSRHFDAQIAELKKHYRVIAYDHRGHGKSSVEPRASMEDIYRDGLALLDVLEIESCHWVGLSTGGFVGQRLAIREGHRIKSLVLMDTSADAEPIVTRLRHTLSFGILRVLGYKPLMNMVMGKMFGPSFLQDPAQAEQRELWRERIEANDVAAMIRFGTGIFARKSVHAQLASIRCPTLVLVGDEDSATTPEEARRIAAGIPGARLEIIAGSGHLCTVVQPTRVTELLLCFLQEQA